MIIEIQHETRLQYSKPVSEWMAEMRVEPVSDSDQSCQSFFLGVSQQTPLSKYQDGFGNRVHHFNLLNPAKEVRALAASVVETHPRRRNISASTSRFPLETDRYPLEVLDFLQMRGPVRRTGKLDPILKTLAPAPGTRVSDLLLNVSEYIRSNFQYAKAVTNASSPVDDVLDQGKGVCQDFAHLMIAILRSYRIPTRYVSGYIHRPNKDSQSHAWCEAWIQDLGWIGIDPTNNRLVDEHFIKVAIGRDFTDVPPNKGIYRGAGEESIFVRVETRTLDRLPTLAWQEQLPPLDVPLTAVLSRASIQALDLRALEEQQQQQQQQQ